MNDTAAVEGEVSYRRELVEVGIFLETFLDSRTGFPSSLFCISSSIW